ncbi:MAG: peptidase U62 [Deltaproteobacteria bacterium]|nr:peptidase U62 [Deltaproteobacteria bacterium]
MLVLSCGPGGTPGGTVVRPPEARLPDAPLMLPFRTVPPTRAEAESPLLGILAGELSRELEAFRGKEHAPYFLGLSAVDRRGRSLVASRGGLVSDEAEHDRTLDVDLRVGSAALDNTHRLRGSDDSLRHLGELARLPLEDDAHAIARVVWATTATEHHRAIEALGRVRADRQVLVAEEDGSPDFSPAPVVITREAPPSLVLDPAEAAPRLAQWSERLSRAPGVLESRVAIGAVTETRHLVTSEGSRIETARARLRVEVWARAVAEDGAELERFDAIDAEPALGLPDDAAVEALVDRVSLELRALAEAPPIDPYAGPALLDGRAAAVFFHEIFGHRMEGHRQKDESEGQTFAAKRGEPVMPRFLDVFDDPRLTHMGALPLAGSYTHDDEGVPAARVGLVEAGVLREFLMSRSPVRGSLSSNGHGRREPGHRVVARQGNLVVSPRSATTPAALRARLLDLARSRGLSHALRFVEITGGYTNTQRGEAQAFKVLPVLVYRVHLDGREELVRGADLEGTPLAALSHVVAAANDFQIFNGVCGAESGWVPVSATSPSLLVDSIEVTRAPKGQARPPLLPRPAARNSAP